MPTRRHQGSLLRLPSLVCLRSLQRGRCSPPPAGCRRLATIADAASTRPAAAPPRALRAAGTWCAAAAGAGGLRREAALPPPWRPRRRGTYGRRPLPGSGQGKRTGARRRGEGHAHARPAARRLRAEREGSRGEGEKVREGSRGGREKVTGRAFVSSQARGVVLVNQKQSEPISSDQRGVELAIRSNQKRSEAIRSHQKQSSEAIRSDQKRSDQKRSEAIRSDQKRPEATRSSPRGVALAMALTLCVLSQSLPSGGGWPPIAASAALASHACSS